MERALPDYGYVAYIDEAGDPGLKRVRPIDTDGASEWLVLSAVVIRRKWEHEVKGWVNDIMNDIGVTQSKILHYRRLSPRKRLAVSEAITGLPLRGFVICSNKKNMRGYRNRRVERVPSQQWFYNWCIRLLTERVTAFCDSRTMRDHGERKRVKIEFSQRGGHRYSQTAAYHYYLDFQKKRGKVVLDKRVPVTDLLSIDLMEEYPSNARAGLQLADCIASSFYQGINTIGPGVWYPEPALALERIMATEGGSPRDFGVCLQPSRWWEASLSRDQQRVFEHYGYRFRRW